SDNCWTEITVLARARLMAGPTIASTSLLPRASCPVAIPGRCRAGRVAAEVSSGGRYGSMPRCSLLPCQAKPSRPVPTWLGPDDDRPLRWAGVVHTKRSRWHARGAHELED